MPEPQLFLSGYDISKKTHFGSYVIDDINIQHLSIVRWNQYSYPMKYTMKWIGNGKPTKSDAKAMLKAFKEHVSKVRVIRSASGRPYMVSFVWPIGKSFTYDLDSLSSYDKIEFSCEGYAKRIAEAKVSTVNSTGKWIN